MKWLSRGIKTVGKAAAFVSKATTNPIAAASDLLQSGKASKSGTPKTPTAAPENAKTPVATRSIRNRSSESTTGNWFMGTWSVFGIELKRWVWLLIVFVILFVIFWFFIKKAKRKVMGRRRTYAARRARVIKRRSTARKK